MVPSQKWLVDFVQMRGQQGAWKLEGWLELNISPVHGYLCQVTPQLGYSALQRPKSLKQQHLPLPGFFPTGLYGALSEMTGWLLVPEWKSGEVSRKIDKVEPQKKQRHQRKFDHTTEPGHVKQKRRFTVNIRQTKLKSILNFWSYFWEDKVSDKVQRYKEVEQPIC